MSNGNAQVPPALALAKAGDIAGAIASGEATLAAGEGDAGLAMFVGVLCCRQGETGRGIGHLRTAAAMAPGALAPLIELARALLGNGANEEVETITAPQVSLDTPAGREMCRIRAQALLRLLRTEESARLFEDLTRADRADFESWDGLGASRLAQGEAAAAIEASRQATRLRPSAIAYWVNLSRACGAVRDFDGAVDAAGNAIMRDPNNAAARLELGRALSGSRKFADALASLAIAEKLAPGNAEMLTEIADVQFNCKAFARAEENYRKALAINPGLDKAVMGIGKSLERTSRNRELLDLIEAPENAAIPPERFALLRARALRGEGRLEEAYAAIRLSPADADQAAVAQLTGDIADRLGKTDEAFAAFSEANNVLAAASANAPERANEYRGRFERIRDVVTPEWYAGWTPPPETLAGRAPLFIFGFPRSGTTLIDTMLGGHPDAIVLEEEATIDAVAEAFGPIERLAVLTPAEVTDLRALYFREVARIEPGFGARLIVDKNPLGLASTPILHRIFPDARFVFVERHPCDVVLSCYITSTVMNVEVANFFDFTGTAQLYDRVLAYWQRCREVLPIAVATVRYETLIADPESELRRLADFAGLKWTPRLLAHQSSAAARDFIGSPSYAQVAEPIYTRAKGRWERYRAHMGAVMPILRPWIERLGYTPE